MTLSDREAAVLFHTYKRLPLEIERGEGDVPDRAGRHAVPGHVRRTRRERARATPIRAVVKAICDQAPATPISRTTSSRNRRSAWPSCSRGSRDIEKIFLANSGTEAIEGTIKLVRKLGRHAGEDGDRLHVQRLPRPHDGSALAHGPAEVPGRIRPVPGRVPRR